jgi:hypothetical protein
MENYVTPEEREVEAVIIYFTNGKSLTLMASRVDFLQEHNVGKVKNYLVNFIDEGRSLTLEYREDVDGGKRDVFYLINFKEVTSISVVPVKQDIRETIEE